MSMHCYSTLRAVLTTIRKYRALDLTPESLLVFILIVTCLVFQVAPARDTESDQLIFGSI